ncbi:MAG: phosphodiesterase YaeI [Deltaproteobacteria bacterium]|nr:phosphodiesterase YaeI [Deltaproteobacteria bacterium]
MDVENIATQTAVTPPARLTRRAFLATVAAGAFTGAWAHAVEPMLLGVSYDSLPILTGSTPIRLAHLSDFHAWQATPLTLIENAAEQTARLRPDLIVITGDFITRQLHDPSGYIAVLSQFSAIAPTFAIYGNHDGGRWVARSGGYSSVETVGAVLRRSGIKPLLNEHISWSKGDSTIHVVGLGDYWAQECIPSHAFAQRPNDGHPTVVLSHNPDSKSALEMYDWDLLLCGHTHGGQLVLPFTGIAPFAPVEDKRFLRGLHDWSNRLLHVSAGVGNLHGLRFNCPPEISLLELKSRGV